LNTSTSISCSSTRAPKRADILYTNIGRGHPFYLDGIVELLRPEDQGDITDVFTATTGVPNIIWRAGRAAYDLGSSAGGRNSLYTRLRKAGDYNTPGPLLRYAGTPLVRRFARSPGPLVVAHPILVSLLRSHPQLVYQHGELIVPPECLVRGEHTVLVPTPEAAAPFIKAGHNPDKLVITGLCIEPTLAAAGAAMQTRRRERYTGNAPLTGGFFSSGAEPSSHITMLVTAAISAVLHGGSTFIVARRNGRYARAITRAFATRGLVLTDDPTQIPPGGAILRTYRNRTELSAITGAHFEELDYFVSPSHERSNWAVGLGLPMFIVDPPIGTYAPRNRELLLAHGVAEALETIQEAHAFGTRLETLRQTDTLAERAEAGWGRYPIDGFKTIAEWLA
jgi:hypothetical protein